jgi:hypothetical protein
VGLVVGLGGGAGDLRKGLLFLKKKKQKDFSLFAPGIAAAPSWKSFLVLFFKKEPLAFFTRRP